MYLLYLLLLFPTLSLALSSDAGKPLDFTADHTSLNETTNVLLLTGHVELQQGTTHLQANKLEVYRDKTGETRQVIATGKLAHYHTLSDHQQKPLDAWGETIQYYPQQGQVVILGKGSTIKHGDNEIIGDHLVYDMPQQSISSQQTTNASKSMIIVQPNSLTSSKQNS